MCEIIFNDKRIIRVLIISWAVQSALLFYVMIVFELFMDECWMKIKDGEQK
jgi:hypothetical protein